MRVGSVASRCLGFGHKYCTAGVNLAAIKCNGVQEPLQKLNVVHMWSSRILINIFGPLVSLRQVIRT